MATENEKDFSSLLYPFALGCLEREDYELMMEYFKSNQDYPWQEFGEYQNLVALLPSFLNIEVPDVQVKDRVARKLYRLRDQQRPQRGTQIITPTSPAEHKNFFQRIETPEQKLFSQISEYEKPDAEPEEGTFESPNASPRHTETFEPVSTGQNNFSTKHEEEASPIAEVDSPFKAAESPNLRNSSSDLSAYSTEKDDERFSSNFNHIESGRKEPFEDSEELVFESSLSNYSPGNESLPKAFEADSLSLPEAIMGVPTTDKQKNSASGEKIKHGISPVVFVITFFVLAGTIGAVYYFLSKDFKKATENQAAKYEAIVQSLQSNLSSTKEVDALLASINLQMVTLKSTPKAEGAYGKLLFDAVTRKAMVQVVNLPVLSSSKVYQLWIISNNQKYSAGIYTPTSSQQYFPVADFSSFNLAGPTAILVTEEVSAGGEKPSKDVYLAGQVVL
ncbi:MAG: anti-sigma factor [Ignavibacteriaceae bacterium]|jgi:hypothetical protein